MFAWCVGTHPVRADAPPADDLDRALAATLEDHGFTGRIEEQLEERLDAIQEALTALTPAQRKERVESLILGRLLVFFPGAVEGNNYRLMGAQDGWNYHAAVISSEKGWSV